MLKMTEYLAYQIGSKVRINTICTSYISDDTKEHIKIKERTALKKEITIENIIIGIEYILKNQSITGEIIYIDGGFFIKKTFF